MSFFCVRVFFSERCFDSDVKGSLLISVFAVEGKILDRNTEGAASANARVETLPLSKRLGQSSLLIGRQRGQPCLLGWSQTFRSILRSAGFYGRFPFTLVTEDMGEP